tara:strand:+ start:265 stop:654 length:390 start_codon:yes stop_codon:yes gene_type:complete
MTTTISGSNGIVFPDLTSMQTGQQAVKAWVNFNGTGVVAIRAGYNVSSITDGGAGVFVVNFTTAMVDADYVLLSNASLSFTQANIFSPGINTGTGGAEVAPTTSSCSIYITTSNSVVFDPKYVNVSVFR